MKSVFEIQLDEITNGSRGFISIPEFVNKYNVPADHLISEAKSKGFRVERNGRYGYCVFKKFTAEMMKDIQF